MRAPPAAGASPASQRAALGAIASAGGVLHLLPVTFVLLSSAGPAPVLISARVWSLFFFGHFLGLVVGGLGYLFVVAALERVFYGGPLVDFLLVMTGFILVSSVCSVRLGAEIGSSWPALLPGALLVAVGLRLRTGRPLLRD